MSTRARRSTTVRPTDSELLDTILLALGALGPTASMDALAEEAGTTKQTLYAHFRSKDALFERLRDREYAELRDRLFAAYDTLELDTDLESQMRACIEPLFTYAADRPQGLRLLTDERAPHWQEVPLGLLGEITGRILRDGVEHGGIRSPALPLVASMIPAAALAGGREAITSGADPEAAIATMAAFFAGAIRAAVLRG